MTKETFKEVVKLIRGNFNKPYFLEDSTVAEMWFNQLARYTDDDVKKGTVTYMLESSKVPDIRDLLTFVQAEQKERMDKERKSQDTESKYVKCLKCGDNGYTLKTMPNGSDVFQPCGCEATAIKFPWAVMSVEAYEEWVSEQRKKGQHVDDSLVHPKKLDPEWEKNYYGGTA